MSSSTSWATSPWQSTTRPPAAGRPSTSTPRRPCPRYVLSCLLRHFRARVCHQTQPLEPNTRDKTKGLVRSLLPFYSCPPLPSLGGRVLGLMLLCTNGAFPLFRSQVRPPLNLRTISTAGPRRHCQHQGAAARRRDAAQGRRLGACVRAVTSTLPVFPLIAPPAPFLAFGLPFCPHGGFCALLSCMRATHRPLCLGPTPTPTHTHTDTHAHTPTRTCRRADAQTHRHIRTDA